MRMNRTAAPASHQFSQLAKDLHRMGDVERRKLRRKFTEIGAPLLADAKRRAGWSTRIPDAISVRPIADAGAVRVGIELRVSKKVPHARAYEGISQQGSLGHFRHPVFADPDEPRTEWVWRSQPTRPYAWPAVKARERHIRRAVQEAFDEAARECGFR